MNIQFDIWCDDEGCKAIGKIGSRDKMLRIATLVPWNGDRTITGQKILAEEAKARLRTMFENSAVLYPALFENSAKHRIEAEPEEETE